MRWVLRNIKPDDDTGLEILQQQLDSLHDLIEAQDCSDDPVSSRPEAPVAAVE